MLGAKSAAQCERPAADTDLPRRLFLSEDSPIEPERRRHGLCRVGFFIGTRHMATIPVGILGATGMVGQQFIALLANHPWFKVEWLGASERSAGQGVSRRRGVASADAAAGRCRAARWSTRPRRAARRKLVFSGLDSSVAGEIEGAFARGRPHHRQQLAQLPDGGRPFPLLIPEVNADHLALLDDAGARRAAGRDASSPTRTAPPSCWRWRSRRCASSA